MVNKSGWDPYEVWLTRIRPQQHRSIESGREGTRTPERPGNRVPALGYVTVLVKASRIVREVRILLRIKLNGVDKRRAGTSAARRHSSL